ncbi:YPO3983 family protein, partial [Mixta calida]
FRRLSLDSALRMQIMNDKTANSTLLLLQKTIKDNIDWEHKLYPVQKNAELRTAILDGKLPKFDRFQDNINGMGITVHDTWETHIIIESLHIENSRYHARVKYRIQDHFGLDAYDILKGKFHLFRFFRIWFVLQRYYRFGFKPFITNMEAIIEIYGDRKS